MTFGFKPIGPWSVVKIPQYVEEASIGVPPASPVFKAVGNLTTLAVSRTAQALDSRWVGSRDLQNEILLGVEHGIDLTYIPADVTFMKYGTELPVGTGTSATSLAIIESVYLDGVEKYIEFLGCLCDKISVKISRAAGISVTQSFFPKIAVDYAASLQAPITTPTYATVPSVEPWTGISSGADPLTWNSVSYPIKEFNFDVNQNVIKLETNGTTSFEYAAPGNRDISFSFSTWNKDGVLLGDMTALTDRTMVYTMAVVAGTTYLATFNNATIRDYKWTQAAGTNDFVMEAWTGKARGVTLTSHT
jgi:hypothetical protein